MNFSEDGDVGFSPTNLSLNSPLTTVIYYQIGITGNTDRHTDTKTESDILPLCDKRLSKKFQRLVMKHLNPYEIITLQQLLGGDFVEV